MDLFDERKEYNRNHLRRKDLTDHPLPLFEKWMKEAEEAGLECPNAMTFGTVDSEGCPHQRVVLLKAIDENALQFFTNLTSAKARQIEGNANISAAFFWPTLERQVIFQGVAFPLSKEDNETYFYSRPRESQLAALASHQSQPIESRNNLLEKFAELKETYPDTVPAPDFWGGYSVVYHSVEFWQGGSYRLHDRFLFTKQPTTWEIQRLAP